MNTKKIVVKVICFVVMVIVLAALIAGTVIANMFAMNVDRFLGITKDDFSEATEELLQGDQLCQEIEEDSIVLFKNEGALPLSSSVTKLNVFGYGATDNGFLLKGVGSGSSTISNQKKVTLLEALSGYVRDFDRLNLEDPDKYGEYDSNGEFVVAENMRSQLDEDLKAWGEENLSSYEVNQNIIDKYNSWASSNSGSVRPSSAGSGNVYRLAEPSTTFFDDVIEDAKNFSDVAIFVLSRDGGENVGEIPDSYLDISSAEDAWLRYLRSNFGTVIVILNTTNTMHLGFLDEIDVDACIYVGLTGQSGARAIPEILSGKINPSGRYTDIVTKSNAVTKQFDPTWANRAPGSNGITYIDDIYYGYKWYETADADNVTIGGEKFVYDNVVAYPFGYGLSYTTFAQEIVSVKTEKSTLKDGDSLDGLSAGDTITVTVEVTNTGKVAGKEVVQLYYTPEYTKNGIEKAHMNLLDFGKTNIIQPGKTETVTLTFTPYDMASYDAYDKNSNGFWGYELEAGNYELKLMNNSHDPAVNDKNAVQEMTLELSTGLKIDKDPVTEEEVVNRFTGAESGWGESYDGSSYAGLGTDGYEAGLQRTVWFTRADFAGTFPTSQSKGASGSVVKAANEYMNNSYADLLPSDYEKGVNSEIYLVYVAEVDDEGNEVPGTAAKPTLNQLNGNDLNGKVLFYNWDVIKELAEDYDGPLWEAFLNQMTANEMKDLIELGGFHRIAIESVGKPRQYDYDGPAGFNTNSLSGNWGGDAPDTSSWTAYTSEALMGCSWNKGLMLALGLHQGAEANKTNANGWYAPGVNLHRSAYTARNYEYYSEDAVLSGKLAANLILGAKINGLNCYIKHFACSEEGPNPGGVNTWITEQNLRENYLRPFEIAVKEGGANSIMTAFNNVGSSWSGANYAMNVEVLRNEWGFRGSIITDYSSGGGLGGMYTRQGVRAGNDLWLNPAMNSIANGLNMNEDEIFARNCAHNLLYTTVDTLNAYHTYSENPELLGDYKDLLAQYGTTLGISFLEEGYSWWKGLMIAVDVIVALGFVVWALYLTGVLKLIIGKIKKQPVEAVEVVQATEAVETTPENSGTDDGQQPNE